MNGKTHADYQRDYYNHGGREKEKAWRTANAKSIGFQLNTSTDTDILAKLESVPNKSEYIKELIRRDIERSK